MNVRDLLGIACSALMGTVFLRFAQRGWRERFSFAHRLRLMPGTDAYRAGVERAFGVMAAMFYLLGALGVADLAIPSGKSAPVWEGVVLAVLVVSVFLSIALMLTIIWFNRPRFLVPPHMRDQHGTVSFRRR
jgi:hypothetical protein